MNYENTFDIYVDAAFGKKAKKVVVLDVSKLTSIADIFIICSGSSSRQVTAIADFMQRTLKGNGIKPLATEGIKEGHWAILDYGDVIIHIFYEPIREFYDLEGLWSDAKRITINNTQKQETFEMEAEE